jgi:hypothetical protein
MGGGKEKRGWLHVLTSSSVVHARAAVKLQRERHFLCSSDVVLARCNTLQMDGHKWTQGKNRQIFSLECLPMLRDNLFYAR